MNRHCKLCKRACPFLSLILLPFSLTSRVSYGMTAAASSRFTVSATSQSACDPAVETNIKGDFNGWDDETIYKMDNGQIWQQKNYHYHYHYAYHPEVVIYKTSNGCHIKVEGDDDPGVDVERIK